MDISKSSEMKDDGDRNIEITSKEAQICQLNDDCIFHIMTYLSFSDQFNLARTSSHFENAFIMGSRLMFEVFEPEHKDFISLPEAEQRKLLALVGHYVKALQTGLTRNNRTIVEMLYTFCPNVRILALWKTLEPFEQNLLFNKSRMEKMQMESIGQSVCDNDVLNFRNFANIRKLTLVGAAITGEHLKQLKTLRYLSLPFCVNLEQKFIIEMLQALIDLQTLNVAGARTIDFDVCKEMVHHTTKLRSLTINHLPGFEIIAELPSLKYLEVIFDRSEGCEELFRELANEAHQLVRLKIVTIRLGVFSNIAPMLANLKKLKTLECEIQESFHGIWFDRFCAFENLVRITVICHCIELNEGLLHLLNTCKRLTVVEIQSRMPCNTSHLFLRRAIPLLRSIKAERLLPVTFTFNASHRITDPDCIRATRDGIIRISYVNENHFNTSEQASWRNFF